MAFRIRLSRTCFICSASIITGGRSPAANISIRTRDRSACLRASLTTGSITSCAGVGNISGARGRANRKKIGDQPVEPVAFELDDVEELFPLSRHGRFQSFGRAFDRAERVADFVD